MMVMIILRGRRFKDDGKRKVFNLWKVVWLWFCDADGEKSDLKTSKIESNYENNKKLTYLLPKLNKERCLSQNWKKAFYIKLEKIKVFSIKFEHEKYSI